MQKSRIKDDEDNNIIRSEKLIPTGSRDRCAFVMHSRDMIQEKSRLKIWREGAKHVTCYTG